MYKPLRKTIHIDALGKDEEFLCSVEHDLQNWVISRKRQAVVHGIRRKLKYTLTRIGQRFTSPICKTIALTPYE